MKSDRKNLHHSGSGSENAAGCASAVSAEMREIVNMQLCMLRNFISIFVDKD